MNTKQMTYERAKEFICLKYAERLGTKVNQEFDELFNKLLAEEHVEIVKLTYAEEKVFDYYEPNDKGHPTTPNFKKIADAIQDKYRLLVCNGVIYVYSFGCYFPDYKGIEIKDIIKKYLLEKHIKNQNLEEVYKLLLLEKRLQKEYEELNNFSNSTICFLDCMFDARTQETFPHSPEYYCINQIPWKYEDIIKATNGASIDNFFDEAIPNYDDRKMLFQYSGLCLTKDTSQQKFLLLNGKGGTGKSIVIRLIEKCVGVANSSSVPLEAFTNDRFSVADIEGKLLNCCADLSAEALQDTSLIKQILGEDSIRAQRKHKDGFKFRNYAKLLFSTNTLPQVQNERNEGFFRRLLILSMNATPEKPDPCLFEKLEAELPYFMLNCLNALYDLYQNEMIAESDNSKSNVEQMKIDCDVVQGWIKECCTLDKNAKTNRQLLFDSFEAFCEDADRKKLSKNGFYKALRCKNFAELVINGDRYFKGIEISADNPFK